LSGSDQSYAAIPAQPGGGFASDDYNRFTFIVRSLMNRMATMTLVQVKATSGQTVDILPLVSQIDGAGNKVSHGVIHNAPVFRLQGGKSAVIIDPVVGDIGLAIFAHNDISSAKKNKGEALPGSRRKFDWADAIYLGGLLNADPTSWIKFLPSGEINITGMGGNVTINSDQSIKFLTSGLTSTTGPFAAGNGATGMYTSQDGKTVTVINGIVTGIK
jgi:hypothetical protein